MGIAQVPDYTLDRTQTNVFELICKPSYPALGANLEGHPSADLVGRISRENLWLHLWEYELLELPGPGMDIEGCVAHLRGHGLLNDRRETDAARPTE
jgi:hypothetical protein